MCCQSDELRHLLRAVHALQNSSVMFTSERIMFTLGIRDTVHCCFHLFVPQYCVMCRLRVFYERGGNKLVVLSDSEDAWKDLQQLLFTQRQPRIRSSCSRSLGSLVSSCRGAAGLAFCKTNSLFLFAPK